MYEAYRPAMEAAEKAGRTRNAEERARLVEEAVKLHRLAMAADRPAKRPN